MRKLIDDKHFELSAVLEALLSEDITITIREVSRRHPALKNASAFTRNPARMKLIELAQGRQRDARNVRAEPLAKRSASMAETLATRTDEATELSRQVRALVASHAGCILAVMKHGGMPALERFWADYKAVGDTVKALDAVQTGGQLLHIARKHR
jgi:hypothetical protein